MSSAPFSRMVGVADNSIRPGPDLRVTQVFSSLCLAALGLQPFVGHAQMPPKLTTIFPETVQKGSATEIAIEGENLGKITHFVFSGQPGLTAIASPTPTPSVNLEASKGGITVANSRDPKKSYVRVAVSPDASLGSRDLRLAGPGGISNPLTITVSDKKEELEKEPNNSVQEANPIKLPVAINGHIHASSEIDVFKFEGKKNQRLIFDLLAARNGSPLDSTLSVLDSKGKELIKSEDANGFDSLIDFLVPQDGEYFLQIRDFRYQGAGNYKYRIVSGELPYLDAIFPYGGQRGQSVEVSLIGRHLEEASTMKLQIDSAAPLGAQDVRAFTSRGYSNPARFDISAFAEFLEKEPNNATNEATAVKVPGVFNGRIEKEKDEDFFKFTVEKGQRLIFEVWASRFGSPLDAVMTLMGTNGAVLQRNDDAAAADAKIDQTFAEAGEYLVSVRDLLDRGSDRFGYRLIVSPPAGPDFSLKFTPDVVRINRGGQITVKVDLTRSGFGGGVEILPEALPEGVSAFPLLIPSDAASGMLSLSADDTAPLGNALFKLKAYGAMGGKKVERVVQPAAGREGFITVLDHAPFSIDPFTLNASVEQNQSTSMEVAVNRKNGFAGEIKLSLDGLNLKNIETPVVSNKAADPRSTLNIKAKTDADAGPREVFIKGEAVVDGVTMIQFSRPLPFNVLEFPFVLVNSLPRLTLTPVPAGTKSAAAEAEFSVKVTRKGLFTEDINLALEGVPEGVVATKTNITHNVTEVFYKLTATDKAKINTTNTITVVGTSTVNGRNLSQKAPSITLFINAPAEMLATNTVNAPVPK